MWNSGFISTKNEAETLGGIEAINRLRAQQGLSPVKIKAKVEVKNRGTVGEFGPSAIVPSPLPFVIEPDPETETGTGDTGTGTGTGTGTETGKTITPWPQPQIETEPDGKTATEERELGNVKWFYTSAPNAFIGLGTDRWIQSGNASWKTGYYVTDLALVINPVTGAATLPMTQGQLSFKLFGHPYGFSGAVYAVAVTFSPGDLQTVAFTMRTSSKPLSPPAR